MIMWNARARRMALIPLLAAGTLFVAACTGDDEDTTVVPTPTTEAAAPVTPDPAPTEEATAAPEAEVQAETYEVVTVDYAFEDLPTTVQVGASFTLNNASEAELHELVAFRLPDDEDRTIAELLELPLEELIGVVGEPAFVLLALPGSNETIAAVGDGTLTEAGRYAVICAIPVGADPMEYIEAAATSEGPPQVEGGPPHFVVGMVGEVEVVN